MEMEASKGQSGMSRASKKREKKKNKDKNQNVADRSSCGAGVDVSCTTSSKPAQLNKEHDDDECDRHHHEPKRPRKDHKGRADCETTETKSSKTVAFSNDDRAILPPRHVSQISELLLNQVDKYNDNDSGSISEIASMTSKQRANCMLNFLLQPEVTTDRFYKQFWEKKPLLVQGTSKQHRHRLDGILSLESIKQMVDKHTYYYSRDLNVTRYEKDAQGVHRRLTLDPKKQPEPRGSAEVAASDVGVDDAIQNPDAHFVRVDSKTLWSKYYRDGGCTVRLLCPHEHSDSVHALLSGLELEWGCMVGANAYLTPPGRSQGFAPHYDDIEAFCLQLEGQKRWKVYAPIHRTAQLPRVSSEDYIPADLKDVSPVMDVILSPGDLLYMPRGWIHQACTLPSNEVDPDGHTHSLHLTISSMQQWAWVDLMEVLLPEALQSVASSESTIIREGLPRNFLDYMGVMHDNSDEMMPDALKKKPAEQEEDQEEENRLSMLKRLREDFRAETKCRIATVAQEAMDMLDSACDQMAKRFCSDRLPPPGFDRDESVKLQPNTFCRLARPGIARLCVEGGKAVLYHCVDNLRVFHENPLSPMEFEMDDAPAIEQLLTTVEPRWICVEDLFHDSIEDKVSVAQALFDEGILDTRS